MAVHLTAHRDGFHRGFTPITTLDERDDPTGIALGDQKLRAGERHDEALASETAWLLLSGDVEWHLGTGEARVAARGSLFDERPSALHGCAGVRVSVHARTDCEFLVARTANGRAFPSRVLVQAEVSDEHRGQGLVGDAAYRLVRTVFDGSTAPPEAELVLGEVITLPGRWSSYPPHHHVQPELYHYRFSRPEGYGHAELGEAVLRVRHGDTVKILGEVDHPQVAAPGYAMYYAWIIRHLPGARYAVPEFAPEHAWTMAPGAKAWEPRGSGRG